MFPDIIKKLPEADIPIDGVGAYISQGDSHQILFMEFEKDIEMPAHSHCAQWGVVIAGEIELTVNGKKKLYKNGDRYFIPEGIIHSAKIKAGYSDLTFFADAGRYKKKKSQNSG